jgi:hypothetical protein
MDQAAAVAARRGALAVLALVVLAAPPAAAQQVPAGAREPVGAIRGRLYDSLAATWLRDARVWIEGTTSATLTDGFGRFQLDNVPAGPRRVLFSHPALDSIDFPQLGRRVWVAAGETAVADLAVPSLASLTRLSCAVPVGRPRVPPPPGLVFGTLRDADRDVHLGGAQVEVSWITVDWERGRRFDIRRAAVMAVTDSLGNFYACGVPTGQFVTVTATARGFATGRIELILGRRGIARRDLGMALTARGAGIDSISGLRNGSAVVRGRVTEESGAPLRSVHVTVDDAAGDALTDAAGRFIILGMPAGSQMLMMRAIGYGALRLPVELRSDDTATVTGSLHALTVLDTLQVTASRTNSLMLDLLDRLRTGAGHALYGEELRNQHAMSSVLWRLPALRVEGLARTRQVLPTGDTTEGSQTRLAVFGQVGMRVCPADVWIDGLRTEASMLTSVTTRSLIAVEWYPRRSTAPLRYEPREDACGVLLVWTDAVRR